MTLGSLFSGIGGLELGLERAGLGPIAWQVEKDAFCRQVLAKHWPDVPRYDDVCTVGASTLSPVDVICGGFPCQDVSSAGAGAGLSGARSGLWYEYLRIVTELRPQAIVVENVASGARRWLCPVRDGLHELGYRTRAIALSAADVGAPHLRRRVFIIAADPDRLDLREQSRGRSGPVRPAAPESGYDGTSPAPHTNGDSEATFAVNAEVGGTQAHAADTGPTRCEGAGLAQGLPRSPSSHWRTPMPDMVRMVHGIPRGVDRPRPRVAALGNAVVPQCAEVIGRMLREWTGM